MPIHYWSRVSDAMFHWFHQRWIGTISDWLNQGQLPTGCYAIGETYADGYVPDVLAVEDRPSGDGKRVEACSNGYGVAVAESPSKTRFTWEAETECYLAKKDLLAIRNIEGILIAVIEVVSPGNKSSKKRFRQLVDKTHAFLDQGVHVLIIDLFPPTPRDPFSIHQVIWSERYDGEFEFHPDKPLTLASYRAESEDTIPRSFVELIDYGEVLPAMPLFLWPDRYINVDLEQTYQSAWEVYPAPLQPKIESGAPA